MERPMSDEKKKPTHLFKGLLDNGAFVAHAWTETYVNDISPIDPAFFEKSMLEGCVEGSDIRIVKADGTRIVIQRNRLLWYEIGPWKDMPETVKERLELAKAKPS